MTSPESKYSAVSDMDSESHENDSFLEKLSYQHARRQKRVWILHSILLLTSITLFTAAFVKYRQASECVSPVEPAYTREYKSVVDAVGQWHGWQYLGEFGQPSIYRGQPNLDVDAAWERISVAGVISVTKEEVERIGKFSNSTVMLPPEAGGNYMASMDAVHQMHCLDILRKVSYKEYYADKLEHFAHPGKFRIHIDHCIEMLRQVIMCNTDLHILTYDWVDHVDYPWPDFSINRQCRNYDNLLDWVYERRARVNAPDGLLKRPEGAATKPVIPAEYVHEGF